LIDLSQVFQRAIFFTLLNPQPNGAGFAGVRHFVNLDLKSFSAISMKARVQGQNLNYKMVMRHKGEDGEPFYTYENFFTVKYSNLMNI
jgi:NADH dehydrogenase [ubiquinone] 1 alpha subcomplex assembly factor 1